MPGVFPFQDPLSQVQQQILDMIAKKGSLTLSGNRENFSVLHFDGSHWQLEMGDTMAQTSDFYQISPDDAFWRIREKLEESMSYSIPKVIRPSDEDILDYLKTRAQTF